MAYSVCISVCICISVCMFKVSVYNCLAWGVSQYFKLCQGALKTRSYLFEKSLEKILYLWTQREKQSEHRKRAVVVPRWTRGPSATISDGGQKWRPAKEIKQRASVFDSSSCTLLSTSNMCLRSKTNFRAFSSLKLPSCSLNSFTVRDVEVGFGRVKAVRMESLRFICCETTKA